MKKGTKMLLGVMAVVLLLVFMGIAFLTTQSNQNYYTQIDNRWVTQIEPHGNMNYKYTLTAYDEDGTSKDITFETSKILTEDAYLCLKVAPIRGVITWAEIQYDEMPAVVQEIYAK